MASVLPEPNRRNVAAVAAVAALLVVGHVLVPHWSTRYGSYLLAFTVWMAWFVEAVVAYLADDPAPDPESDRESDPVEA